MEPGQPIPELRRIVTRDDVTDYAHASGDQNPLHQDVKFARSVGFDDVIAHGMFTMGHMAACALAFAGASAEVTKLSAQFRATVAMGDELVAGGTVAGVDEPTGRVTLHLWVSVAHDGATAWAIKRGEVVLLPDRGAVG
jgi:acyl dehydratase